MRSVGCGGPNGILVPPGLARVRPGRDAHAKVLAAPFDRDKAERARNKFVEIQMLVDALDRAIRGEEVNSPGG